MAYNCYAICDECGEVFRNYTNQTVSMTKMEKLARGNGWTISRHGKWICPSCQDCLRRLRENKNARKKSAATKKER